MTKFQVNLLALFASAFVVAPLHAQDGPSSLTTLYNMRIGATCEEIAGNYEKLLEKADSRPATLCFPKTNFSRDEIPFWLAGKREFVVLEYTPEGTLWSIQSSVTFDRGTGPDRTNAVDSLIKRFGLPPIYSDYSQDAVVRNRLRNHGEEDKWRAAWSSAPSPWNGRINTHVPIAPCDSLPMLSAAMMTCLGRGEKSWESHLARFGGVVTTASVTVATNNEGRVVNLQTRMYDPRFAVAAEAFYKKRGERLLEQSKIQKKNRDAELLPKY